MNESLEKLNIDRDTVPTIDELRKLGDEMDKAIEKFLDAQIVEWETNKTKYIIHNGGYAYQEGPFWIKLPFLVAGHYLTTRGLMELYYDEGDDKDNDSPRERIKKDSNCIGTELSLIAE